MGNLSCCGTQDNSNQLIIDQIIAEDKMRTKSSIKFFPQDIHIYISLIKKLQKYIKGHLSIKRFNDYYEQMKKIMLEEMKYNLISKMEEKIYLNENIAELEKSNKVKNYETTDYYLKNIKKWENNKFSIKLTNFAHVDKLHNNDIYKGSWSISKKLYGYGILMKTDGTKYQGFWENGLMNGLGRFFTPTGDFFEGLFINGIANGIGEFLHSDGTCFKGNWENDLPHGLGQESFMDGSVFEGFFKNGKKNGQGKFVWTDGSNFVGEIVNDNFNGQGVYIWADGRVYTGNWKNNQMHGNGFITYSDNSFYDGYFIDSIRSGYGKYKWNESKYYEGNWMNGKQHGKGKYFKNGKMTEGIWNNGKIQNHHVMPNGRELKGAHVATTVDSPNNYNITHSSFNESRDLNLIQTNDFSQNINRIGVTKTLSLKKLKVEV